MNDVVVIKLDKEREIRFGHKALKKVEKMLEKPIMQLNMANIDSRQLEILFLCGLNDPELTLEDVEEMLDMAPYNELFDKLGAAMEAAFGAGEKNTKDDKKK